MLALPVAVVLLVVVVVVVVVCLYRSQESPDVATGLGQRFVSLVAQWQHATYVRTRARYSTSGENIKKSMAKGTKKTSEDMAAHVLPDGVAVTL